MFRDKRFDNENKKELSYNDIKYQLKKIMGGENVYYNKKLRKIIWYPG